MTKETIEIAAWGDETYEIQYDGSMWANPSTGAQYGRPEEAMRAVLGDAVKAGGDDPEDEEIAEEIEGFVDAALIEYHGPDYVQ
jgi:hypothetical protein